MADPAYKRLEVDARRSQLVALGKELFTEHGYDGLSMAQISKAGGISKALLYHYFPSKRDYFLATLGTVTQELRERTEPDPGLPPFEQLSRSLMAFLEWVEANQAAYVKLLQSSPSVDAVGLVIAEIRGQTAERILDGLAPPEGPSPAMRAAVRGWLWFMDGACLDWLESGDLTRDELHGILLGTLAGALMAAGIELPAP